MASALFGNDLSVVRLHIAAMRKLVLVFLDDLRELVQVIARLAVRAPGGTHLADGAHALGEHGAHACGGVCDSSAGLGDGLRGAILWFCWQRFLRGTFLVGDSGGLSPACRRDSSVDDFKARGQRIGIISHLLILVAREEARYVLGVGSGGRDVIENGHSVEGEGSAVMLAVFFAGRNLLVGVGLFARRLALVIGMLLARRLACIVGALIVVVVVVGLRDVVLEYGTLRARCIARRGLDALDLVQVVLLGIRLFHFVYIYLGIWRLDVFAHGAPICVRPMRTL